MPAQRRRQPFSGSARGDAWPPEVVPASWVAPWHAAGEPFGASYPYHRASGAALYEPLPVLGRVGTGRAVQWWEGGVVVLGQEFDFQLQER